MKNVILVVIGLAIVGGVAWVLQDNRVEVVTATVEEPPAVETTMTPPEDAPGETVTNEAERLAEKAATAVTQATSAATEVARKAVNDAAETTSAAADATVERASEAAAAASDTAQAISDGAIDKAREAADSAAVAAREAAASATEAARSAGEMAQEAADAAVTSAGDAAQAVGDAAEGTVEAADSDGADPVAVPNTVIVPGDETAQSVPAAPAPEAAPESQETAEIDKLLTVEGFDQDKVMTYVESSDLSQAQKLAARISLKRAENDPERLEAALQTLRDQLSI